jgi:hypothetical protein
MAMASYGRTQHRGRMGLQMNPSTTRFLNVDLDIRSSDKLSELLRYLETFATELHRTDQNATLELNECDTTDVDTVLRRFAAQIGELPTEAKTLWNKCEHRQLNIGIQAENNPRETYFPIAPETLASVTPA